MDFVIFGVGLGATLVVVGWFWRVLGPRLRYHAAEDAVLSGEAMVNRISWQRFCRSGGALWVMGGVLLILAAYAALLLGLSDRTGALIVVCTAIAVFVAVTVWLVLYLRRFGLAGLAPQRTPLLATPVQVQPGHAHAHRVTTPANEVPPAPVHGPPVPTHGPHLPLSVATTSHTVTETAPEDTTSDPDQVGEADDATGDDEAMPTGISHGATQPDPDEPPADAALAPPVVSDEAQAGEEAPTREEDGQAPPRIPDTRDRDRDEADAEPASTTEDPGDNGQTAPTPESAGHRRS